jgi:hypothetical protein
MIHRIELDTIRKYRNASEWRSINRARCGQYEATGDGKVIEQICRDMEKNGETGAVEVWRGATLCFPSALLQIWASGKAGKQEQPEQLRKQ